MERITRSLGPWAKRLSQGAMGYIALNAALLIEEAHWHVLYRLTLWDFSEMKLFGFLLGKTFHP